MPSAGAVVAVVAVVLAALACLDTRVEAISCWDCNSAQDPRCGDPFDSYSIGRKDCSLSDGWNREHLPGWPLNATLCRKLVQRVGSRTHIVRGCGWIEEPERDGKMCTARSGTHDVSVLYCACKGDLCNSAPSATRISLAALAAPLVLLPLARWIARS